MQAIVYMRMNGNMRSSLIAHMMRVCVCVLLPRAKEYERRTTIKTTSHKKHAHRITDNAPGQAMTTVPPHTRHAAGARLCQVQSKHPVYTRRGALFLRRSRVSRALYHMCVWYCGVSFKKLWTRRSKGCCFHLKHNHKVNYSPSKLAFRLHSPHKLGATNHKFSANWRHFLCVVAHRLITPAQCRAFVFFIHIWDYDQRDAFYFTIHNLLILHTLVSYNFFCIAQQQRKRAIAQHHMCAVYQSRIYTRTSCFHNWNIHS